MKLHHFVQKMKKNTLKDGLDAKKDAKRDAKSSFCCSGCYKEYLTLGENIGAGMRFKEHVYLKYGFWPQNVDDNSFKRINASIEVPSCSTSLSKEEEEGTKGEDSSKASACSIFPEFDCFFFKQSF